MKPDVLTLIKTLHLSLENGKSLSNALNLLQNIAKNSTERRIYSQIAQAVQEGVPFSKAVEKHLSPSPDIIQFLSMAERGGSFVKTLKSVVNFLEIKNKFFQESGDKISLPIIYFSLTAIIIIFIRFFAIPFHLNEAATYDPKIQEVIADHLHTAQNLSDILFGSLLLFTLYFSIIMISLFSYTGIFQGIAKQYASVLPISNRIIGYFEKFILLNLFSEMLKNGVSLKTALQVTSTSTMVPKIAKQFRTSLERIGKGEKNFWDIPFFEEIEQRLLAGAGSVAQLSDMIGQFADRARMDALATSTRLFRIITIMAIILLAFAVFVEFFTIVLTQVLIQQEFINAAQRA